MKQITVLVMLVLLTANIVAQAPQKLPPHSGILYMGDSQTSFSYGANGNAVQFQNYGYVSWVNALCPGVHLPKGGLLAVPGETTSHMVNRLEAIRSFNAKILVVLAGTNDPLYAIPPETTKANLRRIYDAGIAAGMQVIAITIPPRFAPNAYTVTVEANRISINAWIKTQAGVQAVDVETALNGSQYFEDGLHTSPLGAFVLGQRVAAVVNTLVAQCLPGSGSAAQLGTAANANPLLSGSSGRLGTNVTGTVATNWQVEGKFAGTAAVNAAKVTDTNGKDQQVLAITGSYTGSSHRVTFNNYAAAPISLPAGSLVEGIAEITLPEALTNIRGIYLKVLAYTGDYSQILADGCSMFATSNKPVTITPGSYVLRTPVMTVGNGNVGQLTTQVVIEFNNVTVTAPVSAIVKINSAGIRRLPLNPGPEAVLTPAGTLAVCPDKPVMFTASAGAGYRYQWNRDGQDIPAASADSFSTTETGTYMVKVSTEGCTVVSNAATVVAADCRPTNEVKTGTISAPLCSGKPLAVPFSATGSYGADNVFTVQLSDQAGSFGSPTIIGTLTGTTGGTVNALLPAAVVSGTGYRLRVVSSSPAIVGTDNGAALSVSTAPSFTSTLSPPAICNNTTFVYTPTASIAASLFTWSRPVVTGIAQPASTGAGAVSEILQNNAAVPVKVRYDYQVSHGGCLNDTVYKVELTVNPSPVARTKNLTVFLDAAGKATLTPQQVDNGSSAFCGDLQLSLDRTSFTCANLGANTVNLRATDASGNSTTAPATITVTETTPPVITNASASPSSIFSLRTKMVKVYVRYTATDNCNRLKTSLSVKSNEPEAGLFTGDKWPDIRILSDTSVELRAEQSPYRTGRVYTITITAKDTAGNTRTSQVTVTVGLPLLTSSKGEKAGSEEPGLWLEEEGLQVAPNPSADRFTLLLKSNHQQLVSVRVVDALGRLIETRNNLVPNSAFSMGETYRPGVYYVEVQQGLHRLRRQLVKLPR